MDLVCSVLYRYTAQATFTYASFFALTGGVVLGWMAVIAGAFDLKKVSESNPAVLTKAVVHGSINASMLIAYTVIFFSSYKVYPALMPDSISVTIVKAFLVLTLIIGNFLGGSLILKHKVAVESE